MPVFFRPRSNSALTSTPPTLTLPADPVDFASQLLHFTPDPVQSHLLRSNPHRCILNCTRQWGKSTVTATKALHQALTHPNSLILVLSPALRQSGEFIQKVESFLPFLDIPARGDGHNHLSLLFPNGSRIIGLPGKDKTIRGFSSVNLLLLDEAAAVEDELYQSVRPMLAASNGALWLISTPRGRRGFFYDTWISQDPAWTRISVPATECPRISPTFLEEERRSMTPRYFRQEYLCEFIDSEDACYPTHILESFFEPVPPILLSPFDVHRHALPPEIDLRAAYAPFPQPQVANIPPKHFFIGVDLGKQQDYTAISIIERATVITGPRDLVTYSHPTRTSYYVRYLERIKLRTSYTEIVDHLAALTRSPALAHGRSLIVDATGVGQPVVDMIRAAKLGCSLIPVVLTGGSQVTFQGSTHRVPRNDLLTRLELALFNKQVIVSSALEHAKTLLLELQNLHRRTGATGEQTIEPWRSNIHDDLVFATALANYATK